MLNKVCNLIFVLYAYADETKMIHYSTKVKSIHELCDEVRDTILEFVDELAEQSFGYIGRPSYNDMKLINKVQFTEDLKELCDYVSLSVDEYYKECQKNKKMTSIVSLIDDFKGKLAKLSFLATFDKHSNYKNK